MGVKGHKRDLVREAYQSLANFGSIAEGVRLLTEELADYDALCKRVDARRAEFEQLKADTIAWARGALAELEAMQRDG